MDDAAVLIPSFFQAFDHDEVVLVGVDADVGVDGFAVVQHGIEDAMGVGSAGDTVDDVIRFIVKPMAVINDMVGDIRSGNKSKGADDGSCVVCQYVAEVQGEGVGRGFETTGLILHIGRKFLHQLIKLFVFNAFHIEKSIKGERYFAIEVGGMKCCGHGWVIWVQMYEKKQRDRAVCGEVWVVRWLAPWARGTPSQ